MHPRLPFTLTHRLHGVTRGRPSATYLPLGASRRHRGPTAPEHTHTQWSRPLPKPRHTLTALHRARGHSQLAILDPAPRTVGTLDQALRIQDTLIQPATPDPVLPMGMEVIPSQRKVTPLQQVATNRSLLLRLLAHVILRSGALTQRCHFAPPRCLILRLHARI